MADVTTDTTVIVRGLVPPRRRRNDALYLEQTALHKKAKDILQKVQSGEHRNHVPLLAMIETACVVARLTNDQESARLALSFVSQSSALYSDAYLLEKAVEIGLATKASGFDVIFMACAEVTGSTLITDDRVMGEKATEYGLRVKLLRDMEEEA